VGAVGRYSLVGEDDMQPQVKKRFGNGWVSRVELERGGLGGGRVGLGKGEREREGGGDRARDGERVGKRLK
jgi:hypothetical protein